MGRAPCCEKMGLKRGPWTPEEDQLLVTYISNHGHGNWRALPKLAGLLRCGKSCRLRWTNYLRPDIKRGNFTKEEEETIFKLHEVLGNRWSTIAARLPGRTDNEIKNVWHTHLKKKLKQNQLTPDTKPHLNKSEANMEKESKSKSKAKSRSVSKSEAKSISTPERFEIPYHATPLSPQPSSSEFSSGMSLPQAEDILWSDVMPMEQFNMMEDLSAVRTDPDVQFPVSSISSQSSVVVDDGIDFWYELFTSEELPELPEF